MHRPFLFARLGFIPFAQPKEGGGDAGGFPSSTATCTRSEKVQMNCRHRESPVVDRRPARSGLRLYIAWPPEDLPSLSSAGGPSRFRRFAFGTRRTKPPKEGPVTSGKLAGTTRLQPPQLACAYRQSAATASGPHRATRCAASCSKARTNMNIVLDREDAKVLVF
jgi:hypothetical protein